MTTILSIQSSVAYGHVGNSAATFPLMRAGIEVWPVLTVHFSNHTGYGQWRGPLLTAADVTDVITGIDERGVLPRVDAVLSGYQGAEDVGGAILAAVDLVKQRSPRAAGSGAAGAGVEQQARRGGDPGDPDELDRPQVARQFVERLHLRSPFQR